MSSDDNDQGFTINDSRRVDPEGNRRNQAEAAAPKEIPHGFRFVEMVGDVPTTFEVKVLPDGRRVKVKVSEVLTNEPQACVTCGERHQRFNTDRPNRPEDCPRHPGNAILGALYPQGPPTGQSARRPAVQTAMDRYDDVGMEAHNARNISTLERLLGMKNE